MRIVSWNMNHARRSIQARKDAWAFLREELRADLVLAQEASPPPGSNAVYRAIDQKDRNYRWGSAIVALNPALALKAPKRVVAPNCYSRAPKSDELPDTHPGACAVADVLGKGGRRLFTAISLYGQWEMMPGGKDMSASARVHRMLSDLTGILAYPRRGPVVLAGDLNLTTQCSEDPRAIVAAKEAAVVFQRLRTWQLVDCVAAMGESRQRLPACVCLDRPCSHIQTYRHNNSVRSNPTQFDYSFVSAALQPALTKCEIVDTEAAWRQSDHCPILLEFGDAMASVKTRKAG